MNERNSMNKDYMWDLAPMFKSEAEWEEAYSSAKAKIKELSGYSETITNSAEDMKIALDAIFEACCLTEKVYLYSMFLKDGDGSDPKNQSCEAKGEELFVQLQAAISYVDPALLSIDEEKLDEMLKEKTLSKYKRYIKNVTRARAHTLDAKGERMLSLLSDITSTPSNAYGMLFNVDVEFPKIKDEEQNEIQLTNGNFGVYRTSKDRRVREEAFNSFFGEYGKYINTSAALYSGSVKADNYYASIRGFESARAEKLFAADIPEVVYDSLISEIHCGLGLIEKYIDVRRKALGLDKIDMFDMYVPIVEDVDINIEFDDTRDIIKAALAPLGERYLSLIDRAYDEHWMDVYENKGKRSGAYSCGVYGVHPYVLLNYTKKLDDLFTVAHELGHAMHSFFSSEAQSYIDHDYTIMAAEVASTVNEVFLTMYLLKTQTEPKKRAYILNHFMESFRLTVFRQTLFAEFEHRAHIMQQSGEPLTSSALSSLYKELLEKYYSSAKINDVMAYEWSFIPHFYTAYYVYQYATGFCAAVSIVNEILRTGNAESYLEFLKLGGSKYPIEELKIAGVDLTKPDAIRSALAVFDNTIDEFAKILEL